MDTDPEAFKKIGERLHQLKIKIPSDRYPHFEEYYNVVKSRLTDLDVIWKRFLSESSKRRELWPLRNHKDSALLFFELADKVKVDFQSLFLFADIYLTELVFLTCAITGPIKNIKTKSFSAFVKSLKKHFSSHPALEELYLKFCEDMEWLDVVIGDYRDKFVVHLPHPYWEAILDQWDTGQATISRVRWKLEEKDIKGIEELQERLQHLIPELSLLQTPWEKVQSIFEHMHKITDRKLRHKAENIAKRVGLIRPDVNNIVSRLADFSYKFIKFLESLVLSEQAGVKK